MDVAYDPGMELTPDLLLEAKFAPARRGYDMAEVDDFLERCAEGLDVLLARLKAEFERAEQAEAAVAELRRELDAGGPGMPAPTPPVEAEVAPAPEPEPVAEAPAPPAPEPAVDEPMRILIHAERTAEAAIADAKAEADRIRHEAEQAAQTQRSEAETLLASAKADAEAEARKAGEEARRAIQTEVTTLRRDRDALSEDIRTLRRWLDDQRGRMRATARELQRIVEDPAALRELPVPEIAEVSDGGVDDATASAGDVRDAEVLETAEPSAEADAPAEAAGADDDVAIDLSSDAGEPTQAVPAARRIWPFDDDADDAPGGPLR